MASKKSLPQKMFIKENYQVLLVAPPENYVRHLSPLPEGTTILNKTKEPVDLVQLFLKDHSELELQLEKCKNHMKPDGWLWISYPKGSSKIKTDINRDSIWNYAKSLGLKAVHQISIDETWSSMRFRMDQEL